MISGLLRGFRYQYVRVLRIQDSAHSVALGLAIGVACGALPCMGVQSLIALPLAFLVRANKIASLLGVWWTNPLTFVPIYYIEYLIGVHFSSYERLSYAQFGDKLGQIDSFNAFLALGAELVMPIFFGSLVLAAILSPLCYVLMYRAFEARKQRRLKKQRARAQKKAAARSKAV